MKKNPSHQRINLRPNQPAFSVAKESSVFLAMPFGLCLIVLLHSLPNPAVNVWADVTSSPPREAPRVGGDDTAITFAGTWVRSAGDIRSSRPWQSPDGLAIDYRRNRLYLTEEDIGRIQLFSGNKSRVIVDKRTPIWNRRNGSTVRGSALTAPEGLALATPTGNGTLYVVEDLPGGRLISFSLGEEGQVVRGSEIELPGIWLNYAWESVAVNEAGELLLAGSSMESAMEGDIPGAFEGVVLFKDLNDNWWIPLQEPMTSFSSVSFDASGSVAFFADEVHGQVGWIDLSRPDSRAAVSRHTFKAPEGLAVLPNGLLAIAEESGSVVLLDPEEDRRFTIAEGLPRIESIAWDATRRALLVTSDQAGSVIVLRPERRLPISPAVSVSFPQGGASAGPGRHVPEEMPHYMRGVVRQVIGGLGAGSSRGSLRELADRVPMMAIEGALELTHASAGIADPYDFIQFAAFAPNHLTFGADGVEFPVSAFAARKRSGELVRTRLMDAGVAALSSLSGRVTLTAKARVPVPYSTGASVCESGSASIHFLGMGKAPDFSVVVNPRRPADSYLLVVDADGTRHQYRINLPAATGLDAWVIALEEKSRDPWIALSAGPAEAAASRSAALGDSPSRDMGAGS